MERSYTPGPWTAGGTYPQRGNECWICDSSIPHKVVAKVDPDMKLDINESFCNSHLIAAAPKLLEALESLLIWSENAYSDLTSHESIPPVSHPISKAKSAIKKALNL
jgi:hypothetical protein